MSATYELMKNLLQGTSLYSFAPKSMVHSELLAYDCILCELWDALQDLTKQALIPTATQEGLSNYEWLLGTQDRSNLYIEQRREMIVSSLCTTPQSFTQKGILQSLKGLGVTAKITVNYQEETLTVQVLQLDAQQKDYPWVIRCIHELLPAHMIVTVLLSEFTWDIFESKNLTFNQLDANEFTWNEIEINGSQLT